MPEQTMPARTGRDIILIDGRGDLPAVRSLCRLLEATGNATPVILVTTEGGLDVAGQKAAIGDAVARLQKGDSGLRKALVFQLDL